MLIYNTPFVFELLELFTNRQLFKMYKRKDNDIFGTNHIGYAPRIENHTYIDPNAAFKKKTEQNYQQYQAKLSNVPQTITGRPLDSSNVNQRAQFEDNYHRNRKQIDMQSSIFYPPTPKITNKIPQNTQNDPLVSNKPKTQTNFGRKQVFKREINQLPLNTAQIRGNSSRLFDLDQRIKLKSEENIPMIPLIPHQMKWDQHDSIKYSHINYNITQNHPQVESPQIHDISQSTSTVFQTKEGKNEEKAQSIEKKMPKQQKYNKHPKDSKDTKSEKVQIKVMKGWNHKFMQGLSKHCKLNNSAILSFQADEESKVTLNIKRSDRWQNVCDWLRKDCKLKIRVMN